MDWRDIIGKVAPLIGTALGGPLGGMAASLVSRALLGKETASEAELEEAVANATPEQLLALKQAEYDFRARLEELGIKKEEISAEDRSSARKREIALKDKTPMVLAYLLTVGFFALIAFYGFYDIPPENRPILNVLIGVLGAGFTGIIQYYFGSSAGSARKTEMFKPGNQ